MVDTDAGLAEQVEGLIERGDLSNAVYAARLAATNQPYSWFCACLLARTLLAAGDAYGAYVAACRATQLGPSEEWPWRLLAILAWQVGDTAAIGVSVDRLLYLAPDRATSHELAGLRERRLGNKRAAEAHYRRALELEPSSPRYMALLATMVMTRRRGEEADRLLRMALQIDPTNWPARLAGAYFARILLARRVLPLVMATFIGYLVWALYMGLYPNWAKAVIVVVAGVFVLPLAAACLVAGWRIFIPAYARQLHWLELGWRWSPPNPEVLVRTAPLTA